MGNDIDQHSGSCCEIHGPAAPDIGPEMAKATLVSLVQAWQVQAEVQIVGSSFAILLLMIVLTHCIVWQTVTSRRSLYQILCEDKYWHDTLRSLAAGT